MPTQALSVDSKEVSHVKNSVEVFQLVDSKGLPFLEFIRTKRTHQKPQPNQPLTELPIFTLSNFLPHLYRELSFTCPPSQVKLKSLSPLLATRFFRSET